MEFRWIQISLFLTALLHFTGAPGLKPLHHTVRAGDDVTLFCENLIRNQSECGFTTWVYTDSSNTAAVELVTHGRIGVNAGAKSDRLIVTANCSLLIKKVTEEDVGRYDCQQYPTSGKQIQDAAVHLSVLTMTQQTTANSVTFSCSVWTYEPCTLKVKWVYEGKDVGEYSQSLATGRRLCSINVTFKSDQHIYKSGHNSLQCEVTENSDTQLFPFRFQASGEKPDWLRLYITVAVVLFIALVITVVVVIRWKRAKGNKTTGNDDAVCYDEDDDTATYVNMRDLSAAVRLH